MNCGAHGGRNHCNDVLFNFVGPWQTAHSIRNLNLDCSRRGCKRTELVAN